MAVSNRTKLLLVLALGVSACTDPGQTTGIGAATGGALGAGLGAIVGSQTGNAGAGLAIGAAAGAAAGATVGNALEAQDKAIRSQDEALARQDAVINAQKKQIEDLKMLGQDKITFRDGTPIPKLTNVPVRYIDEPGSDRSSVPMARMNQNYAATTRPKPQIAEANLVSRSATASEPAREYSGYKFSGQKESGAIVEKTIADRGGVAASSEEDVTGEAAIKPQFGETDKSAPPAAKFSDDTTATTPVTISPIALTKNSTPECEQGLAEIQNGQKAGDPSDKLFHFRRALRLCPEEPSFHNGLGELYLSLNRRTDAEFEFKQALKFDAGFNLAQKNLDSLGTSERY